MKKFNHEIYKQVILVLLIILLGSAVYANSLHGQFIWDDAALLKDNAYVKDWSKLIPVFTRDSGAGSSNTMNFYRPLQLFTYMISYSLWGLNVAGYHLTNVLLHILVALAVYRLSLLIFASIPLSFFTAILFVAHPVHTEVVSCISGRADSLSALFILMCLIFYIKSTREFSLSSYILMVSSCILAFLSKENAIVITPLLLLYHYIFRQKLNWRLFLTPLTISLIYLFARAATLQSFFFGPDMVIKRIPGFFAALAGYLKILLLPVDLHLEYSNKLFAITEPRVLFGLGVFFLLLFLAFKKRKSSPLTAFAVFWFFIALLPTTSIYPIHFFYMSEHWLYLPSIGFFLLLGWALASLYEKKNYRFAGLGLLLCFLSTYSYLTVKQNNYWRNELEFYKRTLQYAPDSYIMHNNLGSLYASMGNKTEAIKEYLEAINLNPRYAAACSNLGNTYNDLAADYADMGKIDEAIRLWNEAVRIDPGFAVAHFNLSVYYFKRKQYALALRHCDKVLELGYQVDPRFLKELEPFRK